jgi:hypothetical protein
MATQNALLKPTAVTFESGEPVIRTYYDLGVYELAFSTMTNMAGKVTTYVTSGLKEGVAVPNELKGVWHVYPSVEMALTVENMLAYHNENLLTADGQVTLALAKLSETDTKKSPYDLGHPEELRCLLCGGSGGFPGRGNWVQCKPCAGTGLA